MQTNASMNFIRLNMRLSRIVPIVIILFQTVMVSAQSIDEIRQSPDFLSGTGTARSLRMADNDAIKNISIEIAESVRDMFGNLEDVVYTEGEDDNQAVTAIISTYSQSTMENTGRIIVKQEPNAEVFRYVKLSDVNKIFESRKNKVLDMLASAAKAEKTGKIDDALRYYYWGYCLMQSLPNFNTITNETGKVLADWIPERINDILDDICFVKGKTDGNYVELKLLYQGRPVSSLDYTYFDGINWSDLYSARDGRGIIEMHSGAYTTDIQVKCEYEFFSESHIDKEVAQVVETVRGRVFDNANLKVNNEDSPALIASYQDETVASERGNNTLTLLNEKQSKPYRKSIDAVVDAIKSGRYDSVKGLFTDSGMDMFNKLISYGKGRLVGVPDPVYMSIGNEVVCRSIPINFSFQNNKRQFVENITFTFNADKKIDCLAFGLDERAADDILHHDAWGEYARKILTEFLENYKTAYSLKRLDYLRQVFDDNALIITGKVFTRPQTNDAAQQYINNQFVQRTQQSKEQYLRNLERCFESNEFINIRFAENDIVKANNDVGEVYGIQIKQDYYSTNYGDTGYMFLIVDLNNPKEPIIKVRVWNAERDPDFKGLYSF